MGRLHLVRLWVRDLVRVVAAETRRTKQVIVSPEKRQKTANPIFIIGVHRSGTTLLRLILDSHPNIACPPETFFVLPLQQTLTDAKAVEGLSAMGFTREHVLERLEDYISYYFEMYAAAKGKRRWADKTPPYIDCLDFIESLYGPSCQYIFVYRHGLDAACSMAGMEIREVVAYLEECGNSPHAAAARYWSKQCEKMLAFQASHGDRCFQIRYEEMMQTPEDHIRAMLEFLGEPWDPCVLEYYNCPHDHWIGLQDGKAAELKGFRPNIGRYKQESADHIELMTQEAGPMLTRLGYSVERH